MRCDRVRDAASARLDGEPIGMSPAALDHHLATCADCARWSEEAVRLTRLTRLGSADVPDLAASILDRAVLPTRRVMRRRRWLRVGLALAGVAQLAIAGPSLFGDSIGMAMSAHAAHESAAWNVAVGVAFVAAASRPRRASGLVPVLLAFVAVLGVLSVQDVLAGVVTVDRLTTHIATVVGLLLVVALDRAERALPPGYSQAESGEDGGTGRLRTVA